MMDDMKSRAGNNWRIQGRRSAVLIALLAGATFFLNIDDALGKSPHPSAAGGCSSCHSSTTQEDSRATAWPKEDNYTQCANCHNACDPWREHGERVVADFEGGSDLNRLVRVMNYGLPLDTTGRVTCLTCHEVHTREAVSAGERRNSFLRLSNLKRELCLNCHRIENNSRGDIHITFPPDKVIIRGNYLPLLGRIDDFSTSHIEVSLNGSSFPLKIQNGIFYSWLKLQEGVNRLVLSLDTETLWEGDVFQVPFDGHPVNYKRIYYGHQTESREECLGCHQQFEGKVSAATLPLTPLCSNCHDEFNDKKFVHGPLAVGDCLSCHDPHGGFNEYHLRAETVVLCLSCHSGEEVSKHEGGRQRVEGVPCSSCHDPHQSDNRYLTKGT